MDADAMLSPRHAVTVVCTRVRVGDCGSALRTLRREAGTNGDDRVVRNRNTLLFGGSVCVIARRDHESRSQLFQDGVGFRYELC